MARPRGSMVREAVELTAFAALFVVVGWAIDSRLMIVITVALYVVLALTVLLATRGLIPRASPLWLFLGVFAGLGLALMSFGLYQVLKGRPECVPSAAVECREIFNGRDVGEATFRSQRTHLVLDSLLVTAVGAAIVVGMVAIAVLLLRDRRSRSPRP